MIGTLQPRPKNTPRTHHTTLGRGEHCECVGSLEEIGQSCVSPPVPLPALCPPAVLRPPLPFAIPGDATVCAASADRRRGIAARSANGIKLAGRNGVRWLKGGGRKRGVGRPQRGGVKGVTLALPLADSFPVVTAILRFSVRDGALLLQVLCGVGLWYLGARSTILDVIGID